MRQCYKVQIEQDVLYGGGIFREHIEGTAQGWMANSMKGEM